MRSAKESLPPVAKKAEDEEEDEISMRDAFVKNCHEAKFGLSAA